MTAALAAALVLPGSAAFGAGGPGYGGGGGAGGGGGTGGGGEAGGGEPTDTTGSLYSDLVVALRNPDGTPVIKRYYVPAGEAVEEGEEPVEEATYYCVQPVSYTKVPGLSGVTHQLDGREVYPIPLQGELIGTPGAPAEIEPCDPQVGYAMYVSEAELERLNLSRTSDDVIASKLAEFVTKWQQAKQVSLDSAGRITFDGTAIDASPDYAALYSTLMRNGGIKISDALTVSTIDQAKAGNADFKYGPFELAAVAVGTAAGKYVPITVDTIQYYNRVVGFTVLDEAEETLPEWPGLGFIEQTAPPATVVGDEDTKFGDALPGSEHFVNYNGFQYNRSETFPGSVTWLDVPTLTWRVSPILDVVDYTNLTNELIGDQTLHGVTAFAQMADDVRATIAYLHENEVIAGFYMDPVGIDTTTKQENALEDAAVDLKDLPLRVFPGMEFPFSAALYNPWGGSDLVGASMRLTVDAADDLATEDLSVKKVLTDGSLLDVSFAEEEGTGNLVATFPTAALSVAAGYRQVEDLLATVQPGAPAGPYDFTLELLAGESPVLDSNGDTVQDVGTVVVEAEASALFWAGDVVSLATQGSNVTLPLNAYAPTAGQAELTLTVSGPGMEPLEANPTEPTQVEPRQILFTQAATHGQKPSGVGEEEPTRETDLSGSSLKVFGVTLDADGNETGTAQMPIALVDGRLVGTWSTPLVGGAYTDITWFLNVADFAPLGTYTIEAELGDFAPVYRVPTPSITLQGQPGTSVTFSASLPEGAADTVAIHYCLLRDDSPSTPDCQPYPGTGALYSEGPMTLDSSADGDYRLEVWAVDSASEESSQVAFEEWTVDTAAPSVDIERAGVSSNPTFTLTANEPSGFEVVLLKDGEELARTAVSVGGAQRSLSLSDFGLGTLSAGKYVLVVTATDAAENSSEPVLSEEWTVAVSEDPGTGTGDTGGGVVNPPTDPTTPPADGGSDDPVVPPVGPSDPGDGDGDGQGGPPDTFIGKGPQNRAFVLGHSVTYRLRSTGKDVQYRVMLNNRFDQTCDRNVCVVDGLKAGKNVLRFAAQAGGQRDATPVVRTVYVPRNVAALRMTNRWRIREAVHAFDGDLARTNRQGQVIRTRARDIKRIALIVAKGKGNGQVEVYLGQRLLTSTPIDLSAPANQHRVLVPVATFRKLRTGPVRVRVVSQGKPVRIEGIGIVNR